MAEEFIGSGWAFPLHTDATGGIALVSRDREVEEAIRLILGTAYGERPMRPDFGCAIHEYVFSSADATTAGGIAHEVRQSLERWEPRIDVREVIVTDGGTDGGSTDGGTDGAEGATLYIDIRYTLRGTNDPRNLVFPFYVIPGATHASHQGVPHSIAPERADQGVPDGQSARTGQPDGPRARILRGERMRANANKPDDLEEP